MNLSEKNEFLNRLDKFDYLSELEETELNAIVGGAVGATSEVTYVSPAYADELVQLAAALDVDVETLLLQ
ncbi:MAG: hypothetical protein CLLPBCKN_002657 [Chroococcidiopsis cubana SAG 39.79]|jgi:dihydrodipicolinate synthase/N-acetylneuraminate lyase|uniref:Uncharacterized protein n=2 Tax=Chroococcidiopsis TaxID=54298 RepID=K9TTZ1_CHRTP|nr:MULTISPECIES: hypothetical protein [Chroococcidiopsis]PSB47495.1 hypothetical protein C7B80_09155 [Cyanosarcina cf. burmensis CCALA 770]AFY86035.1 hypothetical protein Chro_0489 [Chroococcidiopsis thermalis PCC 7203]MDZ4873261.1 hypothetical protein [Chroococcidiopsis cubana SAG 39.79]PSB65672.1 hypothetical protein C7B79_04450 [Chroococcidiopsis cubana CCALA 043]PSM51172.1 hypothetical protein C7Y66_00420 [Chroococcidiopsis sp. CCALA 051]